MNVGIAFLGGILSFASPCVLPLVPAFVVNIAGEAALSGAERRRTFLHAVAFVLGFSAVFTLLWVAIALIGAAAGQLVLTLQRAAGVLLVVLGLQMLGLVRIPFLERSLDVRLEGSTRGYPRSFLIGAAFGIGFTPCVGTYLALILSILLNTDVTSGAVLLLAYSLGLGVPFMLFASGLGSARAAVRFLSRHMQTLSYAGGTLVIVVGLLLISGQFTRLAQLFNFLPLLG